MLKRVLILGLVAWLAADFISCQFGARRYSALRRATRISKTSTPPPARTIPSMPRLRSLYDALYIYRSSETIPHLVDSYEVNDDATVWTFHLKDNAVFHDGSSVNADAVVYSFNRILAISWSAKLALVHHR